jgi:hypothetical protein
MTLCPVDEMNEQYATAVAQIGHYSMYHETPSQSPDVNYLCFFLLCSP